MLDVRGRLVAATLNPDFATTPGYYRPYGFDLTPLNPRDTREGAPVRPSSRIDEEPLDLLAHPAR
ncbi:hypothetical protein [Streptomyces sp. SID3343]|uniref:hypothetical protein n=1 Tax=Streptomyces sp. SID3343 TaxID=2690260 RepID=UPI00136D12A4|nr:hypothetical protein [Streptomyces sp. SID3343]MYW05680.1 hypothetical protein [Streptomyces sp. SID3343]